MNKRTDKRKRTEDEEPKKKSKAEVKEEYERGDEEQAEWEQGLENLKAATKTLLTKYGFNEETKKRIVEVVKDATNDAMKQKGATGKSLLTTAKKELCELLERRKEKSLGKLGKMSVYDVWEAKRINGVEWLFYPPNTKEDIHLSWLPDEKDYPVHVKIVVKDKTKTFDYNSDLKPQPRKREGQSDIPGARTQTEDVIKAWQAEMDYQEQLRAAIEWLS
jgi:hypothetical protein